MGPAILVEHDIEKGEKLIQALDRVGAGITTAFWRYIPEASEWRLVIATPQVDREGPRAGYEAIEKVLRKEVPEMPLWQVSVVTSTDPFVRVIHRVVKTLPSAISGFRFTNSVVGNVLIDDVYVYRSA